MKRWGLALLLLIGGALEAHAGQVLLSPPTGTLTAGATFQIPVAVNVGTGTALGGYLYDVFYDTRVLSLSTATAGPQAEFSANFYTSTGVFSGAGAELGLNGRALLTPTGAPTVNLLTFQVTSSTAIFTSSQTLHTAVTVNAVQTFNTSASTIPMTSATLFLPIVPDTSPPITSIFYVPTVSTFDVVGRPFVGANTEMGLGAQSFGIVPPGIAQTYIAVDTTSFSVYGGTFSFAVEGIHGVSYYSVDNAGNAEVAHSTSVAVDLTPPVTTLEVLGSSTTNSAGALVVSSDTALALAAADPVSNGVVSGSSVTYYVVDSNPFSPACEAVPFNPSSPNGTCANELYVSSFTLTVGTHTVYYFSEDAAGNQETVNVASVTVPSDVLPPRTSFIVGAPSFSSGTLYASDLTVFALSAIDDLVTVGDGAGVGIAQTYVAIDTAAYAPYAGIFSFSTEGLNTIQYYSVDFVGNAEVANSTTVAIDLTPPITTLSALGVSTVSALGVLSVSSGTPLALAAVDPVSNGVASGVALTYYVIDSDPFSPACAAVPLDPTQPNGTCANEAYDGAFTLTSGTHTVYYFSEDNVGNQELENVASVQVTTTSLGVALASIAVSPSTAAVAVGGSQAFVANGYFTDGSSRTLAAADGIAWSVDAASVAAVSSSGVATALATGASSIIASSGTTTGAAVLFVPAPSAATYLSVSAIAPSSAPSNTSLSAAVTGTSFDSSAALTLQHFFVAAGTWTTGGALTTARQVAATVLLHDGRVLTAGGYNAAGTALSSAELFNPVAGTWTPAASMSQPVYAGMMVVLANGQVLYAGGRTGGTGGSDTTAAQIYDPVANTWLSTGAMLTAVEQAMTALLPDGRVLVASGYSTASSSNLTTVQLYNPTTGAWSAGPAMAVPHSAGGITLLPNGQVLVAGGYTSNAVTATAQLFNPATNTWSTAGSMATARGGQGQVLLANGQVLAAGGGQIGVLLNSSELYNPTTNAWTPAANLSVARSFSPQQQVIAVDGRALAIGGAVGGGYSATVESYEPALNVWKLSAPLSAAISNAAALQLNDGRVLTAGGSGGTNGSPVTETLTQLLTMPISTVTATGVSAPNAQNLSGNLNLTSAATGYWDVVVNESGNRVARLSGGFDVGNSLDVTPPTLTLTPPIGSTVAITTPTIAAVYVDTGSAVSTATLKFALDGVYIATRTVITASSATYIPTAALSQGTHTVTASIADLDGNVAYATSTFFLDSIPPVTSLQVDGLTAGATNLALVTTDTIDFVAVDSGTGVAETLYALDASSPVVYTTAFHVSSGTHTLAYHSVDKAGNVEATHTAALSVKLYDVTPPTLTLTPPIGSTVTITTPTITAVYVDTGSTVSTATFKLTLDGTTITTHLVVTASSATYVPPAALAQGTHTVTAQIADANGNVAYATSTFFLDSIPPVTSLQVDGLTRSATSLVLVTTDTIGFVAVDSGTGVAATYYSLNGGTQTVYVSTFSLADGSYTLGYHSVDKAGNVETAHTVSLTVKAAVVAPPTLTLTPAFGALVDVATPTITAVYIDTGSPVVTTSFVLTLDGVNVTAHTTVGASTATYIPSIALAQGSHTAVASIANAAGLRASATSTFFLDSIPPVTTLLVDGLTRGATSLVIVTTDTIGFVAVDTGSGVAETLYSVNSTTYVLVYTAPFSLAMGNYTIDYHSVDKAGNVEKTHVVGVDVMGPGGPFSVRVRFEPFAIPVGSSAPYEGLDLSVSGARDASMIDPASLKLTAVNGVALTTRTISVLSSPAPTLGEENGQPVLEADVSRAALVAVLPVDAESAVTVAGSFKDGTPFTGAGRVRLVLWWIAPRGVDAQFLAPTGAGLYLPSGAVTPGTEIASVLLDTSAPLQAEARADAAGLAQLVLRGTPYSLDSTAWFLSRSAALSLPYDPRSLGFGGTLGLVLAYWNEGSQTWTPLASLPDPVHDKVTASVSRLGVYQVASSQNGAIVWSSPSSFGLRGNTAAPNPSRGGAPIDFQLQTGLADSVQLDVYMANGAHVLSQSVGAPSLRGGQYYYDFVWSAGGVTTGSYSYVFTARKAGMPDVTASGRVALYR